MKLINKSLIENVVAQAEISPRKRMNYNFHETLDANVQRMLNVLEPDSYIQPHKHEDPDKFEAFIILKGKISVIEFDDNGNILTHCTLSAEDGIWGSEIAPKIWHCIIALEPASVVYEVKDGPYSPLNDKNFATWAPKEGDPSCNEYMTNVVKRCNINL